MPAAERDWFRDPTAPDPRVDGPGPRVRWSRVLLLLACIVLVMVSEDAASTVLAVCFGFFLVRWVFLGCRYLLIR